MDLEALVTDMDASLESLCSASETAPLLHNGQHARGPPPPGARPLRPQASPRHRVPRSQPLHILAARWVVGPADPSLCPAPWRGFNSGHFYKHLLCALWDVQQPAEEPGLE